MPFFVYKTAKLPVGALRYHEPKPVSLAGGGLIRSSDQAMALPAPASRPGRLPCLAAISASSAPL
jgi:hypothetical protein